MSEAGASRGWFATASSRPGSRMLLFCLPYAGAGDRAYLPWARWFPPDVELAPVRLPGRDTRIAEPLSIDPVRVAGALAARADRPYAIYGHSMGARLAFEVVRELRRRGGPMPVRCYVGAARPPDEPEPLADAADRGDADLVARVAQLGGGQEAVYADPDLRSLLLPILRADLRWLRGVGFTPEPPLAVPMLAFAGTDDRDTGPAVMRGWRRHAAAGFGLHELPGGHFFAQTSLPELARLIADDLPPSGAEVRVEVADQHPAAPDDGWVDQLRATVHGGPSE